MNLERLEQAIAIMKRAGRFNIEKWQNNETNPKQNSVYTEQDLHTCGSVACFGGWIAVSPEWKEFGGRVSDYGAPFIPIHISTFQKSVSGEFAIADWLETDTRIISCIVYSEIGANTLLWEKETGGTVSIFFDKATKDVTALDVVKKLEAYRTPEGIKNEFAEYLNRYKNYFKEYIDNQEELKKRFDLWEHVTEEEAEFDFNRIQEIIDDFTFAEEAA